MNKNLKIFPKILPNCQLDLIDCFIDYYFRFLVRPFSDIVTFQLLYFSLVSALITNILIMFSGSV